MSEWFDAESHVERAHEAYEAGRWEEAESALRDALALNPWRAEWHFNLGITLEAAGRFAEAAKAFSDAHELDHDDPQACLMTAVNRLRSDDPAGAIPWLELAAKLDPTDPDPYVHRIEAYARLADHEQAEVMFYLAQQIDPDCAAAYGNLAESLMQRAQYERAVWCLREAAHHDPELPRVHARMAAAYSATGRLERARQLYLRELRGDPGDIDTLLDLGTLLVDMNRFQEAGEKFRRVLEIESDNPHAHFCLGELAQREGRLAGAMDELGVVLRLDPEYPGVRRRLAACLLARADEGDREKARALLTEETREFRASRAEHTPNELAELGTVLLDARMPAEAREALGELVARRPGDLLAWHRLSLACYQIGDRAAGMDAGRRALEIDAKHIPAMHNLAVACAHDGQWRRARYWVRQGLRVDPGDAGLRRLRLKLRVHRIVEAAVWLFTDAFGPVFRRRSSHA